MASSSTIKGIVVEIGGDTSKLQASFRDAEGVIRATQSQIKELNAELSKHPANKALLTDKYNAMKKSVQDAKAEVKSLEDMQKQMDADGVDKNSDAYKQLQAEIDVAKQKVKDLEKDTKNFGSVGAQQIKAVGEKIKGVGQKMADVGGTLTTTVTAPIVAGATAAVTAYGDVDKQFALVKQTMGDTKNTAEDFQGLWDQMGTSAKNSVYGMQDAADALLNFARQGFTAKEATNMLTPAMSLAAGTGTELDTVTAGLGNALKMFGADSSEATTYANVLATAQAQANTDTTQLFEAMSVAGPICKTVGWDVRDLATITDLFGNAGISGSEGANALKTGLARLASPAKSGAESMDKLGLSTGQTFAIFDDQGNLKSMPTVLENLRQAFDGLSQQEQLEAASNIFGKNQMAKWMTLIQSSPADVQSLRSALDDTGDSANNMANALMSGTGGAIEQLKSTFDVFKVELGEQLAPAFEPVIHGLTDIMNKMMNLDPQTQQMIIRIAAVAAAIGPLLLVGGKLLIGIGQLMTFAPALATAFTALTGPIGGVILIIGGLIAAGVALATHWDWVKAQLADLKNGFASEWNDIKTTTAQTWENVKTSTAQAWTGIKTAVANSQIGQTVGQVWEAAKTTMSTQLAAIKSAYDAHGGGMKGAVSAAGEAIKQYYTAGYTFLNTLTNGKLGEMLTTTKTRMADIKTDISTKWTDIKTNLSTTLGNIQTDMQTKWNTIKTNTSNTVNNIKTGMANGFNEAKSTVSGIFDNIKSSISEKMNAAHSAVRSAIDRMKSAFHFS